MQKPIPQSRINLKELEVQIFEKYIRFLYYLAICLGISIYTVMTDGARWAVGALCIMSILLGLRILYGMKIFLKVAKRDLDRMIAENENG